MTYHDLFIYLFFKSKIEFYYGLINMYVCEILLWRFEPRLLPLHPTKYLYLWSDYHAKSGQWL